MPLDFYVYYKDTVVAHVWISENSKVNHEAWECPINFHPLPICPPDVGMVMKFLEGRCTDRNNAAIDILLSMIGLSEYNPIEIIRKTHGTMIEDFFWVRFSDEPVYKWEDLYSARNPD